MPFESTVPQAAGHAAPPRLQRTAVSGWPALVMAARNACVAPNSTLAPGGEIAIAMSLVIVSDADPDFVESAWLVAVICTVAGEGRSPGAVKVPSAAMVPVTAVPPATPFTLHVTLVSVAFFTVAVNAMVFPNKTVPLGALTVTLMEGGGGGGGPTRPAPPPTQPRVQTPVARRARGRMILVAERKRARPDFSLCLSCGRGRMPSREAGEGPAKVVRPYFATN